MCAGGEYSLSYYQRAGQVYDTSDLGFYINQMKGLLEDEDLDLDGRLMEATHFGMRRLRERHKGDRV